MGRWMLTDCPDTPIAKCRLGAEQTHTGASGAPDHDALAPDLLLIIIFG